MLTNLDKRLYLNKPIINIIMNAVPAIEFFKQFGIAAIYLILGSIIHLYFTSNGIVSAIWPGSGFALAVLLIGGKKYILGILSGSLLLNSLFLDSPWAIAGMTLAQVSEAFLGAWLIIRSVKTVFSLNTLSNYLYLFVSGGCVACILGAFIGVSALLSADMIVTTDYLDNILHWWMGDVLGVLLVTPFVLALRETLHFQINAKQLFEVILLITLTFIAGQVIFLDWFHDYLSEAPRAYVMFLFVAWASMRLGAYGSAFVLLMIATQALWGAKQEIGFFANEIATANLKNYWFYMTILSTVGIILGIHVKTINLANETIRIAKKRFSDLVNSTDGIVWEADAATFNFTYVSCQAERLLGYSVDEWYKPGFWVEHLHPEDREWVPKFCAASTKRMEAHDFEYRMIAKDGRAVWLRDIVNVVVENGVPRWLRGIMIDITSQKRAESDLRIAATAFEAKEGMMITDVNKVILRVNSAFTKITGYTSNEVCGKTPKILSSGLQDKNFYKTMWNSINQTGSWRGEVKNRRKNGDIYPQYLTITSVTDQSGKVINYVATLADISETKAAEEEIKYLAFYDHLTGLPNRRLLLDRLSHALASSTRSKHDGALLFIDMDNFKNLNDTLGHDLGDKLLVQVAERLNTSVREGDTVSRFGGDEFVVLLEELSKDSMNAAKQAETVAKKILACLKQPYQLGVNEYHSGASIGVSIFNDNRQGIEELLKQADIAMYQAKKSGRNTISFYDPEMQKAIVDRLSLEVELRRALEKRQFQLYYQIQVDDLNRPLGAESLIRWQHPERGLVSPAQFIPLAEDTGLIVPIGEWALETACIQITEWQKDERTRDLVLSVNVSAQQFNQANFVVQLESMIRRYAIKPGLLKLELTESMLVDNIDETILTMNRLKEIGITFSLDDFGTGYSSLKYLKQLPLDQLKIDQSFVRDIVFDNNDRAIVSTIIAMAQSMNLKVIAEGVETKEQQELLLKKVVMLTRGTCLASRYQLNSLKDY